MVYLAATLAGTLARAHLTGWTLSEARDLVDVTPFGASNRVYVQGIPDLKGTFAGFMDMADDLIFLAADSDEGCAIALYPSDLDLGTYWVGPGWLQTEINTSTGVAVAVTGSFSAAGTWTRHFTAAT
jgi:hypothetical protein